MESKNSDLFKKFREISINSQLELLTLLKSEIEKEIHI